MCLLIKSGLFPEKGEQNAKKRFFFRRILKLDLISRFFGVRVQVPKRAKVKKVYPSNVSHCIFALVSFCVFRAPANFECQAPLASKRPFSGS